MKYIAQDNFFENVDRVLGISQQQSYFPRTPYQHFEGKRTKNLRELEPEFYYECVQKFTNEYFNCKPSRVDADLFFHRLSQADKNDPHWKYDKIHTDDCIASGIVYLTANAPMTSGTQTYTIHDNKHVPDIVFHNKFNRMIMFPGEVDHSAMDIIGGEKDRLTLLLFIYDVAF